MPRRSAMMQTSRRSLKNGDTWAIRVIDDEDVEPDTTICRDEVSFKARQNSNESRGSHFPINSTSKRGSASRKSSGGKELSSHKKKPGMSHRKSPQLATESRIKREDTGVDNKYSSSSSPTPLAVSSGEVKRQSKWDHKFGLLKDYRRQYGTCLVPNQYLIGSMCLSQWVAKQRSNKRRGLLDPARREQLNRLGFIWDLLGPQAQIERSRVPNSTSGVPEETAIRRRTVTPDASVSNAQPPASCTPQKKRSKAMGVKRILNRSLTSDGRNLKKHKHISYKTPDQIVIPMNKEVVLARDNNFRSTPKSCMEMDTRENNASYAHSGTTKLLQNERTPEKGMGAYKMTDSEATIPKKGSETPGKVLAIAAVGPTRKSSRKRVLSHKLLDDMFVADDLELSDIEVEGEAQQEHTLLIEHQQYTRRSTCVSEEDSIEQAIDSEDGMYRQCPVHLRNHWQNMYDHGHEWYAVSPNEVHQSQHQHQHQQPIHRHDPWGGRYEQPTSQNKWQPIYDEYTRWQALEVQEIQWEEQNKKEAGWVEMHAQDTEWKIRYSELVRFCMTNGHCRVRRPSNGDSLLSTWASEQRKLSRQRLLSAERKSLLDQIGFAWRVAAAKPEAATIDTNLTFDSGRMAQPKASSQLPNTAPATVEPRCSSIDDTVRRRDHVFSPRQGSAQDLEILYI